MTLPVGFNAATSNKTNGNDLFSSHMHRSPHKIHADDLEHFTECNSPGKHHTVQNAMNNGLTYANFTLP
jgi:hypothetical protein